MAPSLGKAFKRKWWIACTAILENLTFAAVLLGWSSLLLMLKNEGFYAYRCYEDGETIPEKSDLEGINVTLSDELADSVTTYPTTVDGTTDNYTLLVGNETEKYKFMPSGFRTCVSQDEILNRYFSIGSSLLSAVTICLGAIMDTYGSRAIRLTGSLTFACSCFLFAYGSTDPTRLSSLMIPAVCMNGAGGITYIFTSFPIPNFFENLRSTMIALMIGSYSASALIYMLFKALYDMGIPFSYLMMFHGSLALLTTVNAFVNQPGVPIPAPGDLSYAISLKEKKKAERYDQKSAREVFDNDASDPVGRRLSNTDLAENGKTLSPEKVMEEDEDLEPKQSFWSIVFCSPVYISSVLTMCLTQLRLIAYMGWLELYFTSSAERMGYEDSEIYDTVNYYAQLFGLLQINCFFMAPVIGQIMDWNLKSEKNDNSSAGYSPTENEIQLKPANGGQQDVNGNAPNNGARRNIKKQQMLNLFRAFFVTNLLLTVFGVVILIDNFNLQIVAFVLHTIVRTFLHSSTGGLYAAMFHFSHFGKLTGVTSFTGAIFILIQDPMFVCINSSFGGNPFWLNVGMLVFTLTGFILPGLLWREANKLSDYEPVAGDDRFCITDDGDTENLVASARSIRSVRSVVNGSCQDVTVSKGALVF